MEVHQTTWPLDYGSMMTTSGDGGVTETQNERRRSSHLSNSNNPDWATIISNCFENGTTDTASADMESGLFGIDHLSAEFGAMQDHADGDPSTTTSSSFSSSSAYDPSGAPLPFQDWPMFPPDAPVMGYEQVCFPIPTPWVPQQRCAQPMPYHGPLQGGLGIRIPPTSHPIDIAGAMQFHHRLPMMGQESPMMLEDDFRPIDVGLDRDRAEHSVPPLDDVLGEDEERDGADPADPCYAQLLYQCLKEAPDHTLSLRELYEWVTQHSQKAKDPKNRGWQNSVRHNLSMNAAFARVPHHANSGPKKGSLWRLTEEALRVGVISTTRYRKDPKRKPERRAVPALNRQTSGAKGGRATRDATLRRRQEQQQRAATAGLPFRRPGDRQRGHYSLYSTRSLETSPQPGLIPPTPAHSPYFLDDPAGVPLPMSAPTTPPHPHSSTPPSCLQFTPYDIHHHAHHPHYHFKPCGPAPAAHNNHGDAFDPGFEFLPLDYSQGGIFGDHDPEMHGHPTPTPSLMTEVSFMTDDNNLQSGVMNDDLSNVTNGDISVRATDFPQIDAMPGEHEITPQHHSAASFQ